MDVRPGGPDDVAAITAVFHRAWWHAYEDVLPYDQLSRWEDEDAGAMWAAVLAEAGQQVFVATTADGAVRGLVVVRMDDGEGAIVALYVDPPAQGAGVGRLLHDAAVDALRRLGAVEAAVWIVEGNAHGLTVADRFGWTADGRARQDEGWPAPSVRRRRAL